MNILPLILAAGILARRLNKVECNKQEAMESGMRLAADFVENFNSGELGAIFKKLMKQGATLTGTSAHHDCLQTTTNMRTTLIEQYQAGVRLESIVKSAYFNARDSTVIVNVAHLFGNMGINPDLYDVKFMLAPEDDCTYKIQSLSQTPYGCLKSSF